MCLYASSLGLVYFASNSAYCFPARSFANNVLPPPSCPVIACSVRPLESPFARTSFCAYSLSVRCMPAAHLRLASQCERSFQITPHSHWLALFPFFPLFVRHEPGLFVAIFRPSGPWVRSSCGYLHLLVGLARTCQIYEAPYQPRC